MGDQGEDLPNEGSEEEVAAPAQGRKRTKVPGKRGGERHKRRKVNYADRVAKGLGLPDSISAQAFRASANAAGASSASSAGPVPVLALAPPSRPPVLLTRRPRGVSRSGRREWYVCLRHIRGRLPPGGPTGLLPPGRPPLVRLRA